MRAIVAEDQPFVREDVDRDEALRRLTEQPFKREIVEGLAAEEGAGDIAAGAQTASFYRNDGWEDLCLGPHVPSSGRLGAFTLDRGQRRLLARRREEPAAHPDLRDRVGDAGGPRRLPAAHGGSRAPRPPQARRRPRPVLVPRGDRLGPRRLPSARRARSDDHGGLLAAAPRGGRLRRSCNSPHITKRELFDTSGHLEWYADGMFPPMELDGGTEYYLKPMNCPFHVLIYKARTRSYRELPLRLFEFGGVYRYEKSGVVHGLTRVRGMTQDDAHIFTTREQMGEELAIAARLHPVPAARLRSRRLLPGAVDQARGEGGRVRRGVGRGDRGAPPGGPEQGSRARDGSGWRCLLRPEDQRAGARRDRAHLADVDDPARLPDAPALRHALRGRRQQAPSPDHDPPGAVRIGRAVLRRADRALRGRVPVVACAGAASSAAGGRSQRRDGPRAGGAGARGGSARRGRRLEAVGRQEDPRRAADEDAVHGGAR